MFSELKRGLGLVALTACVLGALSAPAAASEDLTCETGPVMVDCYIANAGSSEVWTVNGSAYPAGNGQDEVFLRCSNYGNQPLTVSVQYINSQGQFEGRTAYPTCAL